MSYSTTPLAEKARPQSLASFVGQQHLLAEGRPLHAAITQGQLHSMILWGPPGCGKTTLARLLATASDCEFVMLSAVLAGVKDVRAVVAAAKDRHELEQRGTLVFVDEVHRFNKSQQDAFLPFVEDGTILFVGATTENPSFEVNNALLSRARVYRLEALTADDLQQVIKQACDEQSIEIPEVHLQQLAEASDGDARRTLNLLEIYAQRAATEPLSDEAFATLLEGSLRRFDKGGDNFYDQISALHKSVRGSSVDGSLYWLRRMLDGGADGGYVARRLVRMASEDIGNADPRALEISINAWESFLRLGTPEGELALAQATVYLAAAPKSNAVYNAWKAVGRVVQQTGSLEVPNHLRNAPTKLMKEQGYGKAYRYAHDEPEAYAAGEQYLPDALAGSSWYEPVPRGLEIKIGEKLARLKTFDAQRTSGKYLALVFGSMSNTWICCIYFHDCVVPNC